MEIISTVILTIGIIMVACKLIGGSCGSCGSYPYNNKETFHIHM